MVTIELKNYYCPWCDRQLASADILCGKHLDCNTKAVWTGWNMLSLDDSHRLARKQSEAVAPAIIAL